MSKQCPCCLRKKVGPIKNRWRNTSYPHDEDNLMYSCVHCIEEDDLNYAHMWAEYYNGVVVGAGNCHYTDFIINRRPWRNVL